MGWGYLGGEGTRMKRSPEVVVVGAGIVGAAIAWSLSQAGARVTVVDSGRSAGGIATPASLAWINATCGNPQPYFDLRMRAIEGWRRWSNDMPQLDIRLTGGLFWELSGAELEAYIAEHAGWGYMIRLIERDEIRILEPGLHHPPQYAALTEDEGSVEPAHAARTLLEMSGAQVLTNTHVGGFCFESGRVCGVMTNVGSIDADATVIAAGSGTAALLACCGIDFTLDTPEGLLVTTEPVDRKLISRVIVTPELHVRQRADGALVAGADFSGRHDNARPDNIVQTLIRRMHSLLGDNPPLVSARNTVAGRPTPKDGFPALGAIPGMEGLHVAVTHSGVTLAPVIGEMLAASILNNKNDPQLKRYAIGRFLGGHEDAGAGS